MSTGLAGPIGYAANGDAIWKSWTWTKAIAMVRKLERIAAAHGAHVALAGGVMKRGHSAHDLDVVVYPHHGANGFDYEAFVASLLVERIDRFRTVDRVHRHWRSIGSTDTKHVEVFAWQGRRIDVIRVRA